jgi:hypothetical protein
MGFLCHQTLRLCKAAGLNRRMRKTARPGGVGGSRGAIPVNRPDQGGTAGLSMANRRCRKELEPACPQAGTLRGDGPPQADRHPGTSICDKEECHNFTL